MLKSSRTIWMGVVVLVIASMVLTACGGGAAPAPQHRLLRRNPAQATAAPAEKPTERRQANRSGVPRSRRTPAPAGAFVSKPSGKKTSSGFECPEPAKQSGC